MASAAAAAFASKPCKLSVLTYLYSCSVKTRKTHLLSILFIYFFNTWAAFQTVFLNSEEQQYFEDVRNLSSSNKIIKLFAQALQIKN